MIWVSRSSIGTYGVFPGVLRSLVSGFSMGMVGFSVDRALSVLDPSSSAWRNLWNDRSYAPHSDRLWIPGGPLCEISTFIPSRACLFLEGRGKSRAATCRVLRYWVHIALIRLFQHKTFTRRRMCIGVPAGAYRTPDIRPSLWVCVPVYY